jgi:hypothetical protein
MLEASQMSIEVQHPGSHKKVQVMQALQETIAIDLPCADAHCAFSYKGVHMPL